MAVEVKGIISGFVAVVVGIALIPTVASLAADANLTGATASIVALIPTLFGVGILLVSVRSML
jgi:hypothetical protein